MKKISIAILALVIIMVACKKTPEVNLEYVDVERDLITVGTTTATIQCDYEYIATLKKAYLYYCEGTDTTNKSVAEMSVVQKTLYVELSGLKKNTTYSYYYEFANGFNSMRSAAKTFKTEASPEGAVNGLFTINENGDQVYFSQGNLQYQASTDTWRFAEHQWDMLAKPENMTSYHEVYGDVADMSTQYTPTSTAWIDMFGWGTSGWHDNNDPYNVYYEPWSTSNQGLEPYCDPNVWGYGPSINMPSPSLIESSANYDWGVYNAISNGGNAAGLWRTLTLDEWEYVFHTRSTDSGIHFVMACVNDVNGVILLPDNWSNDYCSLNAADQEGNFTNNVISLAVWNNLLQVNGAVFLPATGVRSGPWVYSIGERGKYWQVIHDSSDWGHSTVKVVSFGFVYVGHLYVGGDFGWTYRCFGISVRLVQDANR